MNEVGLIPEQAVTAEALAASASTRIVLDGRRPKLPDHGGRVLQVMAGHVDLFAIGSSAGRIDTTRRHLFRVEPGEIILDLPEAGGPEARVQVIAVGGPGSEAVVLPRTQFDKPDLVTAWIGRLAKVIAGPNPSWAIRETSLGDVVEVASGERRRGPARDIVWVSIQAGTARVMGHEPSYTA